MFTRRVLMIAALFLITGSVAQAKVSPALEMQQQINVQQLQLLIDGFTDRGLCDLEGRLVSDRFDGLATQSPFNNDPGNDTCQLPVPEPDIFQNIAYAA